MAGWVDASLSERPLKECLRRADLLAALSQEQHADVCLVPRESLERSVEVWCGMPALLGTNEQEEAPDGMPGLVAHRIQNLERLLHTSPVVPVAVVSDVETAAPMAAALLAGGIRTIEVTFRTSTCPAAIRAIKKEVPSMVVGAGTVLSVDQVGEAADAGAAFLVSPAVDPVVIAAAHARGLPILPGVATANDVARALTAGCKFLKFFPAVASGGIQALKALDGPYGHLGIKWMPTGGIGSAQAAAEWIHTLPSVLGVGGSWLLKSSDPEQITQLAAEAIVATIRSSPVGQTDLERSGSEVAFDAITGRRTLTLFLTLTPPHSHRPCWILSGASSGSMPICVSLG
eukprot:TRINITY_DN30906_c0_g1_i2.p1 TRINITY_DN30906_c0_g1~~TRINITY_DN30906_c0_g1_i2.p1  ORF type:complete len:345 (-),score=52.27 TRINITY_DN30906_c0_g1_i2:384-1418(-)